MDSESPNTEAAASEVAASATLALPVETASAARFRDALSIVLRGGVLVAGALCAIGLALTARHGDLPMAFGGAGLAQGLRLRLAAGDPTALIGLGVIILALVPPARVVFSLFHFVRERDTVYIALTTCVLGLLAIGVALGRGL